MKIQFLAALFCVGLIEVLAQKQLPSGWIINLEGDTIHGFFLNRKWDKTPTQIDFKMSTDEVSNRLKPEQVKGFLIDGERYVSALVNIDTSAYKVGDLSESIEPEYNTTSTFLQLLIDGEKAMYYLKYSNGRVLFFIDENGIKPLVYKQYMVRVYSQNGGYERRIAENNRYKGQLMVYLADCLEIKSEIERSKYDARSLVRLFNQYYSCKGTISSYTNERKETQLIAGLTIGGSNTEMVVSAETTHPLAHSTFSKSNNLTFGAWLDLFLTRTNRFKLTSELLLSSFKITGTGYYYYNASTLDITSTFDYKHIITNLLLKYSLNTKKNYFIGLGISPAWQVKDDVSWEGVLGRRDFLKSGVELGITGTAEARFKRLGFEVRYERSSGISGESVMSAKLNRIFLLTKIYITKQEK